jgi:hypothetical protein
MIHVIDFVKRTGDYRPTREKVSPAAPVFSARNIRKKNRAGARPREFFRAPGDGPTRDKSGASIPVTKYKGNPAPPTGTGKKKLPGLYIRSVSTCSYI